MIKGIFKPLNRILEVVDFKPVNMELQSSNISGIDLNLQLVGENNGLLLYTSFEMTD